jgi:hypothetical protein
MQDILSNTKKLCEFKQTCNNKENCGGPMSIIHAKPIIDNKFWIVEQDGEKFATLRKDEEDRFVLSNELGVKIFNTKESLTTQFGEDFFVAKIVKEAEDAAPNEVHGYGTSSAPHNPMFDIKRKLPLFTKSEDSKSLYCAGFYIIRFEKGWVKSFCPKLITLQRYEYQGPFKTEIEMKQVLSNVSK